MLRLTKKVMVVKMWDLWPSSYKSSTRCEHIEQIVFSSFLVFMMNTKYALFFTYFDELFFTDCF